MSDKKNKYVFAVCGDDEHIHTLNFSLTYLKHFTKNEIIVVTDLARNNVKIKHDNIIDIDTPANYDHHQASIFLKTSLHKILDMNHLYCYLDTDVVAIKDGIDNIFQQFVSPIIFASDHCVIDKFSNNAVNCKCRRDSYEKIQKMNKSFDNGEEAYKKIIIKRIKLSKLINLYHKKDVNVKLEDKLKNETNIFKKLYTIIYVWLQLSMKGLFLNNIRTLEGFDINNYKHRNFIYKLYKYVSIPFIFILRWIFVEKLKITEKKIYNTFNRVWKNENGEVIYCNTLLIDYIRSCYNFKHDEEKNIWYDENGIDIFNYYPQYISEFSISCNHLVKEIKHKFNIKVSNYHWHHWNGGVFLFDSSSIEFMNTWHEYTIDIFKDSMWKVRDQGTLIATAWKFGLQNHKRIAIEYNFIADFYKPEFKFNKEKGFSLNNFSTTVNPCFVHVYYEYGRRGWDVWDYIESIIPENDYNKDDINFFINKYSKVI